MNRWRRVLLGTAGVAAASACDIARPFTIIDDARPIDRIVVAPAVANAAVGDTVRFTARVLGRSDQELSEVTVTWSAGDPGVARSLGNGRFVLLAAGTSEVLATAVGQRGVARVRTP